MTICLPILLRMALEYDEGNYALFGQQNADNFVYYNGLVVVNIATSLYATSKPCSKEDDTNLHVITQLALGFLMVAAGLYEACKGKPMERFATYIATLTMVLVLGPLNVYLALFMWDPRCVYKIGCSLLIDCRWCLL
jgi:hypothetical protein